MLLKGTILHFAALLLCLSAATAQPTEKREPQEPGASGARQSRDSGKSSEADAAAVQILLDQANFSPGSIDGLWGDSRSRTGRALAAFQQASGLPSTGQVDEATSAALIKSARSPELFVTYTITPEDTAGPFAEFQPTDWKKMSTLGSLGYRNVQELLGERFHSSPEFLKKLNPGAAFAAGETIRVPNVEPFRIPESADAEGIGKSDVRVSEVVISGESLSLVVLAQGRILYYAPITPGSKQLPMPSGVHKVKAFDVKPKYYFDPQVIPEADVKEKLELPSGPNSPVGIVWIDLSLERYGVHGTPEPEKIGYTESHGCIRLTNWDAVEVARLLHRGDKINFVRGGGASPAAENSSR